MQETKKRRGRKREFAGQVFQVRLPDDQNDYVMAEIERTDRPKAWVVRDLIAEAIEQRQKKGR